MRDEATFCFCKEHICTLLGLTRHLQSMPRPPYVYFLCTVVYIEWAWR
jgi:hypothetical protein